VIQEDIKEIKIEQNEIKEEVKVEQEVIDEDIK
jgi:hypothetical protein